MNDQAPLLYLSFAVIAALAAGLVLLFVSKRMQEQRLLERIERDREAMERSQRQTVAILEKLPLGVVAVEGGSGTVEFANGRAEGLLMGRAPSRLPLTDRDGVPLPASQNPFADLRAPCGPVEAAMIDAQGEMRHLSITSMVIHDDRTGEEEVVHTIEDRTPQVRTELALARSHRLEAMGSLTRGVAHDLNNLLTPILGGIDLVRRDPGISEASAGAVHRALQATGRAGTLVHRLLAFAREQELDPHPVDLKALAEGSVDLFARKLGHDITVYVTARGNTWVEADPNQFELVMLNLMNNARDAMPQGGELRIDIGDEFIEDGRHGLPQGNYVRMSVTDDGIGMTDEVRRRAVEPFYTTKEPGTASGLGLSMVDGFAAQSGGVIDIESRPGHGTRIDMWLPRNDVSASTPSQTKHETVPPMRILLVDDEDLVRHSTADMLEDLGHTVIQASSGAEGVAIIRRDPTIEAIVADHMMPGMTGGAMIHEIWDFRQDVPALLVSGYSQDEAMPADIARLRKPFRRKDMSNALGRITGEMEKPS